MRAGGVACDVKALGITAEGCGVLVDPGYGTAHLADHRHQIAASVGDLREIDDDKMRAGVDEDLGRKSKVLGLPVAPGAAVNVDVYRRVGARRSMDVDLFDLAGTVGETQWLAKMCQSRFAGCRAAKREQFLVGGVDALI